MSVQWLRDLYYFLNKDYGTTITYFKIGKGNIDLDTGVREDKKNTYPLSAVMIPVKSIFDDFVTKNLGKDEKSKAKFLISKEELPEGFRFETEDYFVHGNLRYGELKIEDYNELFLITGTSFTNALPYNVVHLEANDNVGLNDGTES